VTHFAERLKGTLPLSTLTDRCADSDVAFGSKPDSCTVTREAYSIIAWYGRAMAGMTRLATVDQLLRKALVVLDASGTSDGFNNLGGVISWIKSLSASVSNGLRSTLMLEGAAFAASL
jgi:hypothetical protein